MSRQMSKGSYLSANERCYDNDEAWSEKSADEDLRIAETLRLLPDDVVTVLNVGCGDGRVTDTIKDLYRVFNVDICINALRLSCGELAAGSIDRLPFKDRSFDLVLVTEVLEHLPDPVFRDAVLELQRVSSRYVVVTVPNDENLEAHFARCNSCDSVYHLWNHLRRFGQKELSGLLPSFAVQDMKPLGFTIPVVPRGFYSVLHRYGNLWAHSDTACCPNCGSPNRDPRTGTVFGRVWERLLWRLYNHTPFRKKAFLGAVYVRNGLL